MQKSSTMPQRQLWGILRMCAMSNRRHATLLSDSNGQEVAETAQVFLVARTDIFWQKVLPWQRSWKQNAGLSIQRQKWREAHDEARTQVFGAGSFWQPPPRRQSNEAGQIDDPKSYIKRNSQLIPCPETVGEIEDQNAFQDQNCQRLVWIQNKRCASFYAEQFLTSWTFQIKLRGIVKEWHSRSTGDPSRNWSLCQLRAPTTDCNQRSGWLWLYIIL